MPGCLTAVVSTAFAVMAQVASGNGRLAAEAEPWTLADMEDRLRHVPISAVPAYRHGLDDQKDKTDKKTPRATSTHLTGERLIRQSHKVRAPPPVTEEQGAAAAPFFDAFWFSYWGCIVGLVGLSWLYMKYSPPPSFSLLSTNLLEASHTGEKREGVAFKKADSLLEYTFRPPAGQEVNLGDQHQIPENLWSLTLVTALGHAKLGNGRTVTPWLVASCAFFMGVLQMMALVLMSHDLDPNADPITVNPSSPYGSPWTVNAMKIIMSIFMVVALVSEAGECQRIAEITSSIPAHRMNGCPHWLPMSMAAFQYVVACAVVWAGVAVVLSFQSVPDIIYSSMSIMCISNIDTMFYEGLHSVLGLETKWTTKKEEEEDELPLTYLFACKVFLLFPVFLGLFMFVRAWMTGIMPTARIRAVVHFFFH